MSVNLSYDWTSQEGLDRLKKLVSPHLQYEPRYFQLYNSACILNGQDVFCITATGDGKSGLIYIPAIARRDMITLVIEPTNFLESDMAFNLSERGVKSIVINAETLGAAAQSGCDLWKEAKECRYQVITISPESLKSSEFKHMIRDSRFRTRWGVVVVDEAHLVDEWGADFRTAYADIWPLRSYAPSHVVFVALSATVEPGRQTNQILHCLGFRHGQYYLDRRDCERHNVDFIFRDIQYPSTGHEFRDLDWLVPETTNNLRIVGPFDSKRESTFFMENRWMKSQDASLSLR